MPSVRIRASLGELSLEVEARGPCLSHDRVIVSMGQAWQEIFGGRAEDPTPSLEGDLYPIGEMLAGQLPEPDAGEEEDISSISSRLREALGIAKKNGDDLSRELGLSVVTVGDYLKGTGAAVPSPAFLAAAAATLGVNEAWLRYGEGGAVDGR